MVTEDDLADQAQILDRAQDLDADLGVRAQRAALLSIERLVMHDLGAQTDHAEVVDAGHVTDDVDLGRIQIHRPSQRSRTLHVAATAERELALQDRHRAHRIERIVDDARAVGIRARALDRAADALREHDEQPEIVLVERLATRLVVRVHDTDHLALDAQRYREQRLGVVLGMIQAAESPIGLDVPDEDRVTPRRDGTRDAATQSRASPLHDPLVPGARGHEQVPSIGVHEHERDQRRLERGRDHLDDRIEQRLQVRAAQRLPRDAARTRGRGLADGRSETELRAGSRTARDRRRLLDPQASGVQFHDATRDREPEPRGGQAPCRRRRTRGRRAPRAVEVLERSRQVLLRQRRTFVLDRADPLFPAAREREPHRAAFGRELDRVLEQVLECTARKIGVDLDARLIGLELDRDAARTREFGMALGERAREFAQRERGQAQRALAAFDARQIVDVAEQLRHAIAFLVDDAEEAGACRLGVFGDELE